MNSGLFRPLGTKKTPQFSKLHTSKGHVSCALRLFLELAQVVLHRKSTMLCSISLHLLAILLVD